MNISIQNSTDLHAEILRLEVLEQTQSYQLKQRFNSRSSIFSTVLTLFPKSSTVDGIRHSSLFHQDLLGMASRFVLPFILNKTLFRNSNFLIKAFIGIISQKASNYISEDAVSGIWSKVKAMFDKKVEAKSERKILLVNNPTY